MDDEPKIPPPKLISRNVPPKPGLGVSRDWIRAHGHEYRGQWLAVRSGVFAGAADTRRELIDLLGNDAKASDLVITYTP